MKRIISLILVLGVTGFVTEACKTRKTAPDSEPSRAVAIEPVKVLLVTSHTTSCAADGYLWLAAMWLEEAERTASANKAAAEKIAAKNDNQEPEKVQLKQLATLSSGDDITVVEESLGDLEDAKQNRAKGEAEPAKADRKDFDFLVTWNTDYKEHTKRSFNAPLQITVRETLKIEKIVDPSITKTWSFTYVLNAGSNMSAYEKTAAEQTDQVIIPARSSVLNEVRAFIGNNLKR